MIPQNVNIDIKVTIPQDKKRIEAAHECFCTEKAIARVAQHLIDKGLFTDPHAACTQATFLVIGEEEKDKCQMN